MKPARCLCASIIATLCLSVTVPVVAEVATDGHVTIIMGIITEDPNPIGVWLQYRPLPADQVLNASGHVRDDGRPHIVVDDVDPIGVWAYNAGTDHDIALSEWDGDAWTSTVFLTSSTDDELDPRVAIEDDGTAHVVWWTARTIEKVFLATRPAGSAE